MVLPFNKADARLFIKPLVSLPDNPLFFKRYKTSFTSFTEVQLAEYQSPPVNLYAFTEVSQVSRSSQPESGRDMVKLVKPGESTQASQNDAVNQ